MATILVVDDALMERRRAGGLLEQNSEWQVIYAVDGPDALDKIENESLDLVLTDLVMPDMSGLDLVEAVKLQRPDLPIILMTSQGNEHIASDALRAGAASYIPKRMLAESLVSTVRSVLSVATESDENRLTPFLRSLRLQFVLGNDGGLISPLVQVLQERMINDAVPDESERIRVAIALEEALSNAIYHGNLELSSELRESENDEYYQTAKVRRHQEPYSGRSVRVDAVRNPDELRIVICDEGPGFDPSGLPDPTDPENLEKVHGRGLLLIRTFMDDVQHNETGNEITLIKRSCAETTDAAAAS